MSVRSGARRYLETCLLTRRSQKRSISAKIQGFQASGVGQYERYTAGLQVQYLNLASSGTRKHNDFVCHTTKSLRVARSFVSSQEWRLAFERVNADFAVKNNADVISSKLDVSDRSRYRDQRRDLLLRIIPNDHLDSR